MRRSHVVFTLFACSLALSSCAHDVLKGVFDWRRVAAASAGV